MFPLFYPHPLRRFTKMCTLDVAFTELKNNLILNQYYYIS